MGKRLAIDNPSKLDIYKKKSNKHLAHLHTKRIPNEKSNVDTSCHFWSLEFHKKKLKMKMSKKIQKKNSQRPKEYN